MLTLENCKGIARKAALVAAENLGSEQFKDFNENFKKMKLEYLNSEYGVQSYAPNLNLLASFRKWLPELIKIKEVILPIVVDLMINGDMDAISVFSSLHDNDKIEELYHYHPNMARGEQGKALLLGCSWIEKHYAANDALESL